MTLKTAQEIITEKQELRKVFIEDKVKEIINEFKSKDVITYSVHEEDYDKETPEITEKLKELGYIVNIVHGYGKGVDKKPAIITIKLPKE